MKINRLNYFFFRLGYYFTGDGALTDAQNHFQITGRVDDVIMSGNYNMNMKGFKSQIKSNIFHDLVVTELELRK